MNTLCNKSITVALALTVIITVSSDEAYAQRGRSLRGMLQGNSSSNKGGKGSSFSNQTFNLQNGNILQGNRNRKLNQPSNSGSIFSNNNSSNNNRLGNANFGNKSKRFGGITGGNLQNVLQSQSNGLNKNRLQNLKKNKNLKPLGNGGLQNLIGNGNSNRKLNNNLGLNKGLDQNNLGLNNLGKFNGKIGLGDKFQNWINSQQKKGNGGSKLASLIVNNKIKGNLCIDHDHWCNTKPKKCHWWYNWCKPIAYCHPHHHVHCHWNYVTCDYIVGGRVVVEDCRWYLGLKGLLLPGQGVGIEEVTPGSPAAAVGLQPGMVIARCNGIDLVDETVLAQVIAQSGGVLRMDLRLSADGPPATCVVVMQRVHSVNF